MDIRKPNQSFASSFENKYEERHLQKVMENSKNADSRVLQSSLFSTPIKISSERMQTQMQTPTSSLAFLSAGKHGKQPPTTPCVKDSKDAVTARTPLRLLTANKMTASLFSPSPCGRLGSPAFTGKPRRVFVVPPELLLTPARRVPVKRTRSKPVNGIRQSPSLTPKLPTFPTPNSNRTNPVLQATCRTDDRHHQEAFRRRVEMEISEHPRRVPSCTQLRTPLSTSSRADHMCSVICQKHDGEMIEHHDAHANTTRKLVLPKRMLAFTHPQSPCATPISSRKDAAGCANDGQVSDAVSKQHYSPAVRIDDMKPDRLALLKRMLASSPYLSTPARRVPVRQKSSKNTSPQCDKMKVNQKSCKSLKTGSLAQAKVQTCGNTSNVREERTDLRKLKGSDGAEPKQHHGRQESTENAARQCREGTLEMSDVDDSKCREGTLEMSDVDDSKCRDVAEPKQHHERQESTENAARQCRDGTLEMSDVGDSKCRDVLEMSGVGDSKCNDGVHEMRNGDSKCSDGVHEMSGNNSKQHDDRGTSTECADNLTAAQQTKHHLDIKNSGSATLALCKGKTPSKKMSSSEAPTGSTNVKQCKEKKPSKKTSSLEAPPKAAGQARMQICHNSGTTVDARKKSKDKAKESCINTTDDSRNKGIDTADDSRNKGMNKAKQHCHGIGDGSRKKSMGKS